MVRTQAVDDVGVPDGDRLRRTIGDAHELGAEAAVGELESGEA